MAAALKVLAQSAPAAGVETALYTCAADSAVVSSLWICNTSSITPDTFTVRVNVAGAGDAARQILFYLAPLPPNTSLPVTTGITLSNTDVVKVTSTNGTSVFSLFGQENS